MTALREVITGLQERLEAQEKELAALRGAISSAAASPRSGRDGSQNRSFDGGLAGMEAIALEMDLHNQMRAAVADAGRDVVAEMARRLT